MSAGKLLGYTQTSLHREQAIEQTMAGLAQNMPSSLGERTADVVRFLQIEPTTRCNYTCGFCCGRAMDQSNLPYESFVHTLDQFPDLQHIELQGEGEPLIHPRFFDMVRLARGRGIQVSTITNGSLFTPERIDAILESGLSALLVSIESPDPDEFRDIRGGDVETVVAGIRSLMQERNARGRRNPSVGFAVTILKRTQRCLPAIADLYKELGMDGGITVHMLNPMESYRQTYKEPMRHEYISKAEEALVWAVYAKILRSDGYGRSDVRHYYDDIYGTFLTSSNRIPKHRAFTNVYRSCPWLDGGLFVNRHGHATGCARVKDYRRFSLGSVDDGDAAAIIDQRRQRRQTLIGGHVPDDCQRCFIAEQIADRFAALLLKTPRAGVAVERRGLVTRAGIGFLDWQEDLVTDILGMCDGTRTSLEIVQEVSLQRGVEPDEGRAQVLPVLDEMLRREMITA